MNKLIFAMILAASSSAFAQWTDVPQAQMEQYKFAILEAVFENKGLRCPYTVTKNQTKTTPLYSLEFGIIRYIVTNSTHIQISQSGAQPVLRLSKNAAITQGANETIEVVVTTNSDFTKIVKMDIKWQTRTFEPQQKNLGTLVKPDIRTVLTSTKFEETSANCYSI